MYNFLEAAARDLQDQKNLRKQAQTEARKRRHYKDFRLQVTVNNDKEYASIFRRNETKTMRFRSSDEKTGFAEQIRAQRYFHAAAEAADQNIRLLEKVLRHYQPSAPDEIAETMPKAYRPLPSCCYAAGARPNENWLTQQTINELVYQAAGPGARNADVTKLSEMLLSNNRNVLDELARTIGAQRLHNILYPFHPEHLIHRAKDGTWVRSKSEAIEINYFLDHHIDYRYEEPIQLEGNWYTIDFVVLLPQTKRIVFLEHAGMFDREDYRSRTFHKLSELLDHGFVLDQNLFFTFDLPGGRTDIAMLERKLDYILSTER